MGDNKYFIIESIFLKHDVEYFIATNHTNDKLDNFKNILKDICVRISVSTVQCYPQLYLMWPEHQVKTLKLN